VTPRHKAVKKSGNKTVPRGAFKPGPDPRRGKGPPKGEGGRPPLEFKEWCKGLLDDSKNRTQVEEILSDKAHPAYATMFRTIADRAHGKAKEHVTLEVSTSIAEQLRLARQRAKNR
jgi:hypothetical protein